MKSCDLCGTVATCLQKEIDGKVFDICERCWQPLAEKLNGKGHVKDAAQEDLEQEYEEMVY